MYEYIFSKLLSYSKVDEFFLWAFAVDPGELSIAESPGKWNSLHKDLLEISMEGKCYEDLDKMLELWKKNTDSIES